MAFPVMTKPKLHYKNRDLFDKLYVFFGESVNLARINIQASQDSTHTNTKAWKKSKKHIKYGLEEIAKELLNLCYKAKFDIFEILSCT